MYSWPIFKYRFIAVHTSVSNSTDITPALLPIRTPLVSHLPENHKQIGFILATVSRAMGKTHGKDYRKKVD